MAIAGSWWNLDNRGTLTVMQSGDIPDHEQSPFLEYRPSITSIVIQNSATGIGAYTFEALSNAASVTIPDSVTRIGDYAFSGCSALESVTIPDSVEEIGPGAFSDCGAMTNAVISNGVTEIPPVAFELCDSLESVVIPDSVTEIGDRAFNGCTSLSDVYYGGTQSDWEEIYFDSGNAPLTSATVHYNYNGGGNAPAVGSIPAIPTESLGNPLAAVCQTVNLALEKLNEIPANANVGTVTGIIMNGVSKGTGGVVDLGTVLTSHQSLVNYALKSELPAATSDLTNDSGFVTNAVSDLLNYYLKSEIDASLSGKADAATLSALIGADTGKSVRTIANEELAAQLIPENAQESLDTLREISAWMQSHPNEVAAINRKLTLGTNGGEEYPTVKAYVEATVAGLIKLTDLSATTTGSGNAVTGISYDSATGAFSFTKGATFLTAADSGDIEQAASDAWDAAFE